MFALPADPSTFPFFLDWCLPHASAAVVALFEVPRAVTFTLSTARMEAFLASFFLLIFLKEFGFL
jgi:hypothetical protein